MAGEAQASTGPVVTMPEDVKTALKGLGIKKPTQANYETLMQQVGSNDSKAIIAYINQNRDKLKNQLAGKE